MTNFEYLTNKDNIWELAEELIIYKEESDYDEGIDGEWEECGTIDYYIASDGEQFYNNMDAIEHEVDWLLKEKEKI